MMLRRSVRFDGSLMGPPSLQTALGEHAARSADGEARPASGGSTGVRTASARASRASGARGSDVEVTGCGSIARTRLVLTWGFMKVAVLGAGAWGTALARLLADKESDVALWARRPELAAAPETSHENARYLPGVTLPRTIAATHDLAGALRGAKLVVFVVPSHATREVARAAAPHIAAGVPVVSATKGIENESLMFMDEILAQELAPHSRPQLAFLSRPSSATQRA